MDSWRLSEQELALARIYLAHQPMELWTLDDYSLLVDVVVQRYLPLGVLRGKAEALAIHANLMGRVQASVPGLTDAQAGVLAVPVTAKGVGKLFALPGAAARMLDYGMLRTCEAAAGITDSLRHRVK